ncbi:hypothetical protein [Neptunomonas sp.]|uniref:hypothetical protein n=1 Tax=Neptunomonas sp. TaxID=1971898 RepID=UPI003567C439
MISTPTENIGLAFMLPWLMRKGVRGIKADHLNLYLVRGLCDWIFFAGVILLVSGGIGFVIPGANTEKRAALTNKENEKPALFTDGRFD